MAPIRKDVSSLKNIENEVRPAECDADTSGLKSGSPKESANATLNVVDPKDPRRPASHRASRSEALVTGVPGRS
jgi:hypothetical protein